MRNVLLLREEKANDRYKQILDENGYSVEFVKVLDCRFVNEDQLRNALAKDEEYGGLIITSQISISAISSIDQDLTAWKKKPCFVVADATAVQARAIGLNPIGQESGHSKALRETIVVEYKGQLPLLYLTGDKNRPTIPDRLNEAHIQFQAIQVYETTSRKVSIDFTNRIIVAFSPSGIMNLDLSPSTKGSWISIGPTTSEALDQIPIHHVQASTPTPESVLEAITRLTMQ